MAFPLIKLKEVLTESKVEAPSSNSSKRIRVRLHAKGVEKRPEMNDKEGATKYYIRRAGQFVYGRQNLHKGAFGVIPPELDGFQSSSDIPSFDVAARCLPEWVDLFLKQGGYYLELSKLASGVGSQRISPSKFLSLEMPLPSIEQQRAILDQVEFYKVSQSQLLFELTHQQTLLKKLRQQILQEAIEGKLTADWRAQNPDVEPASELLKRIAAEKAQLIKEKKIKVQKPLPPISDEEKSFELPQGWEWCRLANVGFVIGGLTKNAAKRSGHEIFLPYLRVANVYANRLDLTEVKEIGVADSEIGNLLLEKDDLLVVEGNGSRDQVGRIARWDGSIAPCIHQNHVIKVRLVDTQNVLWILYWYLSPIGRSLVEEQARTSTGLYNLSTGKVSNLALAIPPLDEQQAIVTKVEKLFAICDQLETQITHNQGHAEQLMQTVLKEAFSHNNETKPTTKQNKLGTNSLEAIRA